MWWASITPILGLSPVHTECVSARQHASTRFDASNQTNVKDSKHSHRPRRRASTRVITRQVICIRPMSGLPIRLLITINGQNVHVAIGLHHQTTSVLNDVIDNDVINNDVIDSLMNMHQLLASRPNVIASTRRDAMRRARCERGFRPFRSRVRSRHARDRQTERQTDRQTDRSSFYDAPSVRMLRHNNRV